MTKNIKKGYKYLPMEISTLVDTNQIAQKATENIIGKMGPIIEDNSCQECGMEEEYGKWSMVISIKVNT